MSRPRLTYANVTSSLALFVALGGTSWAVARNSIGNRELKRDAVTSSKVKNHSITASDLAASAAGRRGPRGAAGPSGPQGPPGIAPTAEPWRTLPYASGWTDYGQGHQDPAFRKDQLGIVHLRGFLTRSGPPPVGGEVLANLPAGYRPTKKELFAVTDGGATHVRVDVTADGQVIWVGGSTATNVSLSGIAFATD
jgi:hypothetical protein